MPSIFERCSCGAEMDIRDAHYEQCKWTVKAWREAHKHEHFSNTNDRDGNMVVDSSRNDSMPMGFAREVRGLRSTTGDPEPIGDDPEEKRRRK